MTDQFLRTWLHDNCARMPRGAPNHLCWRVVARRAYFAYVKAARAKKKPLVKEEAFCQQVTEEFGIALSDWRIVDGEWEKEFDGLMASHLTETLPRRAIKFKNRAPKYDEAEKIFDD